MSNIFTASGWADYLYWQQNDRRLLGRCNELIRDIERNGNKGIGKPEPLKGDLQGWWSRRIDEKNRLVYKVEGEDIVILSCRFHYSDR